MLLRDLHPRSTGQRARSAGPDFTRVVAFQSLSKRSNLPGLRVGFAAGDKKLIGMFLELRNIAAPQVPVPLQHVATVAYGDEAHVEENRGSTGSSSISPTRSSAIVTAIAGPTPASASGSIRPRSATMSP